MNSVDSRNICSRDKGDDSRHSMDRRDSSRSSKIDNNDQNQCSSVYDVRSTPHLPIRTVPLPLQLALAPPVRIPSFCPHLDAGVHLGDGRRFVGLENVAHSNQSACSTLRG